MPFLYKIYGWQFSDVFKIFFLRKKKTPDISSAKNIYMYFNFMEDK